MPFSDSPSSAERIAEVLYRSLEAALIRRCARDYDAEIVLLREGGGEDGTKLQMQVRCRGLTRMPVRVVVTHVGGTIYDVLSAVEKGGTRRFSYSRPPDGATAVLNAPALGEKVAAFLLGELERRLGRMLLKGPTRPPRPASSTGPRDERIAP